MSDKLETLENDGHGGDFSREARRFSNIRILGIAVLGVLAIAYAMLQLPPVPNSRQASAAGVLVDLDLVPFATGFDQPVAIVSAGDDRLFVVERDGLIRIAQPDGQVLSPPFLDIRDRVDSSASEEGLLGLVFHTDYAKNGFFYANYTNTTGGVRRTRIARFSVTANPEVADPDSEEVLLTITQPEWNHNAGDLHFGPEGFLYIPMGDGGGAGDTANNAQNPGLLLGKIIRIDVDSGPGSPPDCTGAGSGSYTIPADNPFLDGPGGTCDEIWALGLRNPWRASFDRQTGDLYIADVGQGSWEEIDFQPASSAGGENYGWRCYEGNNNYNLSGCGPASQYTFPIFEYAHTLGCEAVVGGFVYRGLQYPNLVGRYFFTDNCSGTIWDALPDGAGGWDTTAHTNLQAAGYSTFGEASSGEIYLANYLSGTIYHLVDTSPTLTPTVPPPTETPTPDPSPTPVFTPSAYLYLPYTEK